MSISRSTLFITNGRFDKLHVRQWWDEEITPKAQCIIVHGYGEHSGRYDEIATYLVASGYKVYSFDNVGHGLSEGRQGYVKRFADYADDVCRMSEWVRRIADKSCIPLFIIGHSMGGLILSDAVLRYGERLCDGVILSGPALGLKRNASSVLISFLYCVSRVLPFLPIKAGYIRSRMLTHDEGKIEERKGDVLCHQKKSLRFVSEFLKAQRDVVEKAEAFLLPVMILQGSDDCIVDPRKVMSFYHALKIENKTCIMYPHLYHEIFNEVERACVFRDVLSWLDNQCIT